MTTKERSMALVLMVLLGLIAGGLLIVTMIYRPYQAKVKEQDILSRELLELKTDEELAMIQMAKLVNDRKLSLPVDSDGGVSVARQEYEALLENLLKRSDFQGSQYTTSKMTVDTKNPVFSDDKKKVVYTKIKSKITATGPLSSLVKFLWNFYRQPLLHSITALTIEKPNSAVSARRNTTERRDLTINLDIEALILDNAEKRLTLMAVPPAVGALFGGAASYRSGMIALDRGAQFKTDEFLAADKRDYSLIGSKDFFYGSVKVEEARQEPPGIDLSPYIRLNTAFSTSEGQLAAELFDEYHKYEYRIEHQKDGSFTSQLFFYAGERKKPFEAKPSKYFEYGTEDENNLVRYQVVGIAETGAKCIYLRKVDENSENRRKAGNLMFGGLSVVMLPGQIYKLDVGRKVREMEPILSRHAIQAIFNGIIQIPVPSQSKQSSRGL